jgi:Calcineurin-like phosphoesterase/Purple acid Phosphatase, N-terminal domain
MTALLIALASLVPGVAVAQGPGDGIVRGPYLQQTRATSTYIVWQTSRPLTGGVHYGKRSTRERLRRAPTRRRLHAVRLDGLSPATTYFYRVRAGSRTTRPFRFTTAKVGAVPFTFGAVGDFGSGTAPEHRNASLLQRESVEFLLTLGDNVYPLGRERGYPPAVFRPYGALIRRVAIWPTLGNHDYGNEGSSSRGTADAYFRNFVLPARPGRERFYSFRYANAEFLAIDSEMTSFAPGSPQYQWIDRALAQSRACWKIPYFHHPVHAEYVKPTATDVAKLADVQRWLVPLFERHGVKLVLTAHEHNYVRSRPLLNGRRHPRGVVYVLAGGGGGALQPLPPRTNPLTAARGRFFHHLLVSVVGRRATVRAIDTAGRVRDRVRLECGAAGRD